MKKLSELYPLYNGDLLVKDIKINSKEVVSGDLFVCINGVTANRNDYVLEAIENGAVAVVSNKKMNIPVPLITVCDPNKELSLLCQKFYDFNPNDLSIVGVTGTNGKTTVASIIKDMIGSSCGYIGTNGINSVNINESIRNTTPDASRLYKYFKKLKEDNCDVISMEASSEAFYRNRLDDLLFDIGIVTNVTEDHLNIHKTLSNYLECKKRLVMNVKNSGFSILNKDDKYFEDFKNVAKGKILVYGKSNADLEIVHFKENINNTLISLKFKNKYYNVLSPLVGEYNIYNLCAAILCLIALNYDMSDIIKKINNITIPKGRCEFLDFDQDYKIILDYAHTTDAFIKIFDYLNKVKKGKLITVTGSAGGREKEKRSVMGKVVLDNSDYVIFTMDDPRYEDVNAIIDDLVSNSSKTNYEKIIDRKEAIKKAFKIAKKDDIVLIAGKGRDNYMAIENKYLPYSDYDVIKNIFA